MTAAASRKQGMGPFVAAAAVALVVVAAVVFWPRDSKTTPDSIACPKTFPAGSALWVPAKAHTSGPGKALVPSTLPEKGVVCGYVAPSATDGKALALTGSKALVGDPRAVVTALRAVPKGSGPTGCPLYRTKTDADRYLLALLVEGRAVWVSIPGDHCAGVSNGTFAGATNLRADAVQALAHGMWPTDPSLTGNCKDKPSTTGSQQVPAEITSLRVCLVQRDGLTHVYRYDEPATGALQTVRSAVADARARTTVRPTASACLAGSNDLIRVQLDVDNAPDFVLLGTSKCMIGSGGSLLSGDESALVAATAQGVVSRD